MYTLTQKIGAASAAEVAKSADARSYTNSAPQAGAYAYSLTAAFSSSMIPAQTDSAAITLAHLQYTLTAPDATITSVTLTDKTGAEMAYTANGWLLAMGDTYSYTVTADGYETLTGSFVYDGAAARTFAPTRLTGTLKALVLDADGNPVANATVQIDAGAAWSALTDDNGYAVLYNVKTSNTADPTYDVYAIKANHDTAHVANVTVASGETTNVTLHLDVTVFTGYVKIVDENETAVAGALVTIDGRTVTSNTSGYAWVDGLVMGKTYDVTAAHDGYTQAAAQSVSYANNTQTAAAILHMNRDEGNIRVFVTDDATGAAVSGATVTVNDSDKTTDSAGRAVFTFDSGTYDLLVTAANYESYSLTSVSVAKDGVTNLSVALTHRTFSAVITVRDNSNAELAVSGATVIVGNQTATTDANGVATVTGLLTGVSYTVGASKDGYALASGLGSISSTQTTAAITLVKTAEDNRITLTVQNADTSDGVPGAIVYLYSESAVYATAVADSNGVVTFYVPNGTYHYVTTKANYNTVTSNNFIIASNNFSQTATLTHDTYTVRFEFFYSGNLITVTQNNSYVSDGYTYYYNAVVANETTGKAGSFSGYYYVVSSVKPGTYVYHFSYYSNGNYVKTVSVNVSVTESDVFYNVFF